MKTVIMPRYLDTPQRIQDMEGGPLKTLAMGLWQRIAAGETIEDEEMLSTCHTPHYNALVVDVDNKDCVYALIDHSEPPRIQT